MVRLLRVSLVVLLSTVVTEVGAVAQVSGQRSVESVLRHRSDGLNDRLDDRQPLEAWPLKQADFSIRDHSWTQQAHIDWSALLLPTNRQKQTEVMLQIPFERSGVLEAGDDAFEDGGLYDVYRFEGQAGQIIKINLASEDFDTRLLLLDADQAQIASNDDSNDSTNSILAWRLPTSGEYYLLVAAYGEDGQGTYQLKGTMGSEQEAKQTEADQLLDESQNLRSTARWQESLAKLEQALLLYQEIGDRSGEGTTLNNIGLVYDNLGQYPQALDYYNQALAIFRDIGDRSGEGTTLNNIGLVYRHLGQYPQALDYYNQAFAISRDIGDRSGEGITLNNIGAVYNNLGQYPQALDYYNQALAIRRDIGDRRGEGTTLNNIGAVYNNLGQYPQALDYYDQALAIRRDIGDLSGEGTTLNNIGAVYNNLGQYPQALDYYNQALAIRRDIGDRRGEGITLNNIGAVYNNLGQYPQALDYYNQALAISRDIGDLSGEGTTLNNIGLVYDNLGQYLQALDYYDQALAISRDIGDRSGEGTTLNNIGGVYDSLGQYPQALDYYDQALAIRHDIGDLSGEGTTLNNIGGVYRQLGQYPQALDYYDQALAIRRDIDDRSGEGITLNNIGAVYDSLGQYPQALDYYDQALVIFRDIDDRSGEGRTLNNIGLLLDTTEEPELAIIFLKQSVNVYEDIRGGNQALTQEQQQSYTNTIASTYRKLADLLLQEDRVLEAQAILDLLRTQELEDYFQDVRSSSNTNNDVDYWKPEETILALYQQFISNKTELANLRAQDYNILSPGQRQRLSELRSQESTLTTSFNDFIERADVQADVAALRQATTGDIELDTLIDLQNNIANLPNALVIYPLIFEDRLEIILVPSDAPPIRRRVEVTSKELNQAILDYRDILRSPSRPAKPAAQKLYNWLIAAIEPDLKALGTQTIVYSPDGALRYIPLAALYDGRQWMAERFAITHITNKSQSDLGDHPTPNPRILAGACAKCSFTHTVGDEPYSFQDLPFTRTEVTNLAEQLPDTDILLDRNFSKTETVNRLGSYNIIHLATHGAFVSSSPDESFILFGDDGDDKVATLREMRSWPLRDVDLVVLSACETGVGSQDLGNGIEVLGLGYQLERAGAKSVIASLWRVDDGGTQSLMNAFYLALSEGFPKAEALRRAQLALIKNDLSVIAGEPRASINILNADTGEPIRLNASPDHPFYWAPFILIGNGL
ncbi:CHAT domain-containing protein [Leptothoe sp. PORK10 BA2]|uniref:CHAT domain-containing protein n=1 Tax=Leptothoe sp. PORK10 BA2 TaxID=3110254 RepID=UPI002B1F3CF3|nr:tetratricopeptide repeat protein [Leptothoe sp. PORK10 BA2]MEA5464586.1 tetratricopeptide repeat protein [Leptothoe sp. PORK10 BA2]